MTDYLEIAARIAPGHDAAVIKFVAQRLHYRESLHLHDLGGEAKHHGACSYCLLRAGSALQAIDEVPYDRPSGWPDSPTATAPTPVPQAVAGTVEPAAPATRDVPDLLTALQASIDRARRYTQCDDTCTVDCGHCKGNGVPA